MLLSDQFHFFPSLFVSPSLHHLRPLLTRKISLPFIHSTCSPYYISPDKPLHLHHLKFGGSPRCRWSSSSGKSLRGCNITSTSSICAIIQAYGFIPAACFEGASPTTGAIGIGTANLRLRAKDIKTTEAVTLGVFEAVAVIAADRMRSADTGTSRLSDALEPAASPRRTLIRAGKVLVSQLGIAEGNAEDCATKLMSYSEDL